MSARTLALIAPILVTGAVLCAAAGPPPKKSIAAARPVASASPFDARDPASLIALLATLDAKAQVAGKAEDTVDLKVTTPAYGFAVQYAGCGAQGRACKAVLFTAASERAPTLAQINAFNQTSLTCRAFQDRAGKPHLLYSALVSSTDSRDEMRAHLSAWQGCLGEFGAFVADPVSYLADAP